MLVFPPSPNVGDQYLSYIWDGTKWGIQAGVGGVAGVASFNTRVGQIVTTLADITVATGTGTVAQGNLGLAPVAASGAYADLVGAPAASSNIGRNLLHNPLFNVAQRGAGPFTTNAAFTADRWQMTFVNGTQQVGVFAISDTDRAAIGDEAAKWDLSCTFTGSGGAGDAIQLVQKIEDVRRLAGKTVTLSFWAIASAALKFGATLAQVFGTGGSPSPAAVPNGQSVSVTTGWTRFSLTFAMPSAAGKTFGTTAGTDYTQLTLYYSAGSNLATSSGGVPVQSGTVNIWGVQLEIGSVATPLEKPDPRYDLSNCQRFYQTGLMQLYGYNLAGQAVAMSNLLPVTMRATPTITPTWTANSNVTAPTMGGATGFISMSASTTASNNFTLQGNFAASADL